VRSPRPSSAQSSTRPAGGSSHMEGAVGEAAVRSPAGACGARSCVASPQSSGGRTIAGSAHSTGCRGSSGVGSLQSCGMGRGSSHERRGAGAAGLRLAAGGAVLRRDGAAPRVRPVVRRATSSRQARGEIGVTVSPDGRCCTGAPRVAAAAAAASSHGRGEASAAGWTAVIRGMSESSGSRGAWSLRSGGQSDQRCASQPAGWGARPRDGGWSGPSSSAGRTLRPLLSRLARSGLRRGDGGRAGLSVCPPTTSQRAPLGRSWPQRPTAAAEQP
jgi:hypothetical protein